MKRKNNKSFRAAFCGIITALTAVMLMLVPVLPVMLYCAPVLAGFCAAAAAEEFGVTYSLGVYIAASILSFLLAADKEAVLVYILLTGAYPSVSVIIEGRLKKLLPKLAVKLAVINAGLFAYYFSAVYLVGVPKESFGSDAVRWIFLVVGNAVMLIYDKATKNALLIYKHKLRKRLMNEK